jgi:hypothetical protein
VGRGLLGLARRTGPVDREPAAGPGSRASDRTRDFPGALHSACKASHNSTGLPARTELVLPISARIAAAFPLGLALAGSGSRSEGGSPQASAGTACVSAPPGVDR